MTPSNPRRTSPYHAVEIRGTIYACPASKYARGQRYLSTEAPRLPLDKCDRPDRGQCGYHHHEDRRGGPRRDTDVGLPKQLDSNQIEQRRGKDRRVEYNSEEDVGLAMPELSYYDFAAGISRKPT